MPNGSPAKKAEPVAYRNFNKDNLSDDMPSSMCTETLLDADSVKKIANRPPTNKSAMVSNGQTMTDERMETYDFPHGADLEEGIADAHSDEDDLQPHFEVKKIVSGRYKPSRVSHLTKSSGNFSMRQDDETPERNYFSIIDAQPGSNKLQGFRTPIQHKKSQHHVQSMSMVDLPSSAGGTPGLRIEYETMNITNQQQQQMDEGTVKHNMLQH